MNKIFSKMPAERSLLKLYFSVSKEEQAQTL